MLKLFVPALASLLPMASSRSSAAFMISSGETTGSLSAYYSPRQGYRSLGRREQPPRAMARSAAGSATRSTGVPRLASLGNDDGAGSGGSEDNSNNLSASARARREEEHRRSLRMNDVIPGRTSAKPDAADYILDISATQAHWSLQATDLEREINELTDRGMSCLKSIQLEEANDAFDRVYELKPDAYLWQAGVVKFYLDDLEGAAKCFASNAAIFESKFGGPASEEWIWRDACELKIRSLMSKRDRLAEEEVSASSDGSDGTGDPKSSGSKETRKVMRIARDLFRGSVQNDVPAVALCRAKLRSICGNAPYGSAPDAHDRKMWKLSSWYYLGLHYDTVGDLDQSKACMKMALRQGACSGNGDDIIRVLPMIHMTKRDWYDDDDFMPDDDDDDVSLPPQTSIPPVASRSDISADGEAEPPVYKWSIPSKADEGNSAARSVVKVSIMESLQKMRLTDLKDTLKRRQEKTTGSKAELQERLLESLLRDAGF